MSYVYTFSQSKRKKEGRYSTSKRSILNLQSRPQGIPAPSNCLVILRGGYSIQVSRDGNSLPSSSFTPKISHFHGFKPLGSPLPHTVLYQSFKSSGSLILGLAKTSFKCCHPGALPQSSAHGWPSPPRQSNEGASDPPIAR